MTVATSTNRVDEIISAGTTEYPFSFRIYDDEDLIVVKRAPDGTATVLTLNTDYTVQGAGDYAGGKVLVSSAFAAANDGYGIVIRRVLDIVQETSIRNQGKFYPETHENVFDRLTMIDQQQQEEVDRSIKYPETLHGLDAELPDPVPGRGLKWSADGTGLVNTDRDPDQAANEAAQSASEAAQSAAEAAADRNEVEAIYDQFDDRYLGSKPTDPSTDNDGNPLVEGALYWNSIAKAMRVYDGAAWTNIAANLARYVATYDGGTAGPFTLPFAPVSKNNVDLYIGGIYQQKDTFSVNGNQLTLSSPAPVGDENVEVVLPVVRPVDTADADSVAYQPGGNGSVFTTVQEWLRRFVTVKDFGAKGDGTTDDSVAFQLAANAVGGNGAVIIPPGSYVLNASVTGSDRLWLVLGATLSGAGTVAGPVFYLNGDRATYSGILGAGVMRTQPNMGWSGLALGGIDESGVPLGPTLMQEGLIGDEGSIAAYCGTANRPLALSLAPSGMPEDLPGEDTASVALQLRNGSGDGHSGEIRGGVVMKKWGELRIFSLRTTQDVSPIPAITVLVQDRVLQRWADDNVTQFNNARLDGSSGGNTTVEFVNPGTTNKLRFSTRANGEVVMERLTGSVVNIEHRYGASGLGIGTGGFDPGARLDARATESNMPLINASASNASYAAEMVRLGTTRAASSEFAYLVARSANGSDIEFNLRGDGNAFADGSWTGGGADYAEFFEWADGNPNSEDRVGISVVLDGDRIRPAIDGEEPIGVISSAPAVVGDAAWNYWDGKFLRDDLGRFVVENVEVVSWVENIPATTAPSKQTIKRKIPGENGEAIEIVEEIEVEVEVEPAKVIEHSYYVDELPDGIFVPNDAARTITERRKLNPDFDPSLAYVPRENRPEWSPVGLFGKLRVRKGQPVGARWVKLKDISQSAEEWLVR